MRDPRKICGWFGLGIAGWMAFVCLAGLGGASHAAEQTAVATDSPQILYVVKSFSVATDSGVYGFPPGTRVTLIKKTGDSLVVTDGKIEGVAPEASFTTDSAVAREIEKQRQAAAPPREPKPAAVDTPKAAADPAQKIAELRQRKLLLAQAQLEQARALRKKSLESQIESLDQKISAADEEISQKQAGQRPERKTYFTSGQVAYRQGPSAYTLSANASGRQRMISEREKLQQQLATLEK